MSFWDNKLRNQKPPASSPLNLPLYGFPKPQDTHSQVVEYNSPAPPQVYAPKRAASLGHYSNCPNCGSVNYFSFSQSTSPRCTDCNYSTGSVTVHDQTGVNAAVISDDSTPTQARAQSRGNWMGDKGWLEQAKQNHIHVK